jgi:hypothetical protein
MRRLLGHFGGGLGDLVAISSDLVTISADLGHLIGHLVGCTRKPIELVRACKGVEQQT